jgi:HK97 family phage portal protein
MTIIERVAKRLGYSKTGAPSAGYREESRAAGADYFGFYDNAEAPANDEDYLTAFQSHALLFAAVNVKAQNAARPPLKVYKKTAGGSREEIQSGWPVEIIQRPNKYMPGYRFRYGLSAYLTLTGDAFIEKDNETEPHHLWLLQPTKMDIRKDPKKKVARYDYEVNGSTVNYQPEEIIHLDTFNPLSEYWGLSSVSPLTQTLTIDFYVHAFEQAFFRNGGHVGLHFTTDAKMDKTIFERMRSNILQAITGSGKNHKVLFTSEGIKSSKLTVDPKEADLSPLRNFNLREILAAIGVPRMLVMDSEETAYANADAQLRVFWEQSIMPHNQGVQDYLNMGIYYPNDMECEFDYSTVAALQENKKSIIDLGVAAIGARILTINEFRKDSLKKEPVPWGDKPPEPPAPGGDFSTPLFMSATRDEVQKRISETEKSLRSQWEDRIFKIVRAYFRKQEEIFTRNVQEYAKTHPGKVEKAEGAFTQQLLAGITAEQKDLIDQVLKASANMGRDFYGFNYRKYSDGKKPPAWLTQSRDEFIEKSVKKFADKIDETTLNSLRGHIKAGEDANETVQQISDRVKDVFDQTVRAEDSRAMNIARTETSKVENFAAVQSFQDLGAPKKTWIAVGPPGDRPEHTAMNGETVPIGERFSNGLRFPGDPDGAPEEIICCRCGLAPAFD